MFRHFVDRREIVVLNWRHVKSISSSAIAHAMHARPMLFPARYNDGGEEGAMRWRIENEDISIM